MKNKFTLNRIKTIVLPLLFLIIFSCSKEDNDIEVSIQTQDMSFSIDENPVSGQSIGFIEGTSNNGSVYFSVLNQTPENSFKIHPATGELTIDDNSLYDYETLTEIKGTVKVSKNNVYEESLITISITDLAEDIYYGDVVLNSQEEVDDFGANSYRVIDGFLEIQGYDESVIPITDLSSLDSIEIINGDLTISGCDSLLTLNGLNNISEIEKFVLFGNLIMEDISALKSITSVYGLYIQNNTMIKTLDCFSNITSLEGDCLITGSFSQSNSLTNLKGLDNITTIGGSLSLNQNNNINDLSNLSSLTSINGSLRLNDNEKIVNLNGLHNLTIIGNELFLLANDNLNNIDDLQNINSIGDAITINNNKNLLSLKGLSGISKIYNDFSITLSSINNLEGLENITSIDGRILISRNYELQSLTALNNLSEVGSIYIGPSSIQNLEGLENLSKVNETIAIYENTSLTDFCAIETLLNNDFTVEHIITENLYNPTLDDIKNGNCKLE